MPEKAKPDDQWIEAEIRMDRGSVQVSHRRDEGTMVYVSDDDHAFVDAGRIDRELIARVLREAADLLTRQTAHDAAHGGHDDPT